MIFDIDRVTDKATGVIDGEVIYTDLPISLLYGMPFGNFYPLSEDEKWPKQEKRKDCSVHNGLY